MCCRIFHLRCQRWHRPSRACSIEGVRVGDNLPLDQLKRLPRVYVVDGNKVIVN